MESSRWRFFPLFPLILSFFLLYLKTSSKESSSKCSLLPYQHYWIHSRRIVTPEGLIHGAVEVKDGIIASVVEGDNLPTGNILYYGDAVVMPGLIDVHAHLDEPGRAEWEGFSSGTKAAAAVPRNHQKGQNLLVIGHEAIHYFTSGKINLHILANYTGGITTLIDMPLNSYPSTVSAETLKLKADAAHQKILVDVGFWGGLVPENAFDVSALENILNAGALGLKSFMCPSGINDFPMTNSTHIKEGLTVLAKYKRPLLVHAEVVVESDSGSELDNSDPDIRSYATYLKTRPTSWEERAIRDLQSAMQETRPGGLAEGAHLHIVHLSDSRTSLDLIKNAKSSGASVSVETCPHYLVFSAEEIKEGDTRFKCSPPIREEANRQRLWEALMDGHIDMLSSDHSPTVPELKLFKEGDFLKAWGGISSLQYVLPATWTYGKKYGMTFNQFVKWWSEKPSKLAGQQNLKGSIISGYHADLVVWNPEVEFELDENHNSYHKHPNISAYMGKRLSGKVLATFVRGNLVYGEEKHAPSACGNLLLAVVNK